MPALPAIDLLDALLGAVYLTPCAVACGFIAWLCCRQRRINRQRRHLTQRHARLRMHPRGYITPELLQAILGIALIIALAVAMVGGFADEPRW